MKTEEHPVWDVYDQYRTARLNLKYYQIQLNYLKRWNLAIETILAISASSSVAGLWFWEGLYGGYLWKIIGSIAAILAVIKPVLNLSDKINKKEELIIGYKGLHHDLEKISILVNQNQAYSEDLKKQFLDALDRKGVLIQKDNDTKVNRKLRDRLQLEVIDELPIKHFYIPRSDINARKKSTPPKSATTATF